MTAVARSRSELGTALAALRGGDRTLALVPTMGALHEGHRALLQRARQVADTVVASIFVNPLQFAPAEDLSRYPRPVEADLAVCAEEDVDLVWMPSVEEMYGSGPVVTVDPGPIGELLEGAYRPGHFRGVLTVVAKLFAQVRPDVAVFGAKDAQQLLLVRRMVVDLDLGVRIEAVETVREPDGLARSSRNAYLSPAERVAAVALSRALGAGAGAARDGAGPEDVRAAALGVLDNAPGVVLDYLALVDADSLAEAAAGAHGDHLLLVAARVGPARLIDNRAVRLGGGGAR